MEFTDPFEAAVVAVAQIAEFTMPKRTSFPSMFPPACSSFVDWSTPSEAKAGFPWHSDKIVRLRAATKTIIIAERSAQPWRVSLTILPNV